ncbi:unnamed protein product [Didymodactylos carnosus]|uniref:DUF659 domain-containing protein n=1 Tax=Didymodactylos carnosus TaxID=1234261 RepID=A0A814LHV3_9BILA|nr:unnamed protein product [Didymodactylos carnosus]CAF3834027.1 unnamed protein product [Didymodactylos carnosus]
MAALIRMSVKKTNTLEIDYSRFDIGVLDDSSSTKKQMKMDQYGFRVIPPNEKLDIDRTLLKALIMNGVPFQLVTNSFFLDLTQKLNPSYCPPDKMKLTRQTLTNELLYVEKKNDSILTEASYLTLNLDGWTDQSHRSLYEFSVITENRRAVVLALVDLSAYKHSAEFLLQRLEVVLHRASTTFNITEKIIAIVTDNPNVMEKLRNLFIAKPAYRHILEFRCFAHAINLIAEFQNAFYLTCFYLHPKYRGAGLHSESRATVYRCIAEYSKLIGNSSSITKNVISALQRYEIKAGAYSLTYGKKRLFSILSWHHSKRRNRLSPFTLEAIAKIHTFYKHNSEDIQVDTNVMEDALGDEISSESNLSDVTITNATADEFQRTMSEYQEILQEMSQSDVIDIQSVDDNDLLQMEKLLNKDDHDLHSLFVEAGLLDQPDKLNINEVQTTTECDRHNDDYDVDDLLKDIMAH